MMDAHSLIDSTTFWVGVAFFIFVGLSFRAGQKATTKWLDGKITKIQHDLEEAARLRREAEELLKTAHARHQQATTDAAGILAGAETQAKTLAATIAAETEKQLARREQLVVERIQQAERQALSDVQRQTVAAALSVVRDILATDLTPAQKEQLAQNAVNDIGKAA